MIQADNVRRRRVYIWAINAALIFGIELAAMLSRGDANWDLRNYHIYAPYALLYKHFGVDVAPAHMQTFFSPTFDVLYYVLARSIPSTPVLNAIIGLPHALALVLAFALTCRLLRPASGLEFLTIGVCMAISATGVIDTMTLATTMSEMLPASLILGALLLLVPADLTSRPSTRAILAAGLLIGLACGLKLTMSYMAVTIGATMILVPRRSPLDLVLRPAFLGIGIVVGALALSGYWWVLEWQRWGNPFFPLMNQVFRSPWAVPDSFVDRTFLPHSLPEALSAPWAWALDLSRATTEWWLRDPRFSLALPAAVVCLVATSWRRPRWQPWPQVFLACVFILGFWLWRLEFSIYRYLAPLETLSGGMIALAALPIARRFGAGRLLLAGSGALLAGLLLITVEPNQNHAPRGTPPLDVDLGPLPSDSLVLLLDHEPTAYLAAFADPRIRFVGTNDFFMSLNDSNPMQKLVADAIDRQQGPIFGVDCPGLYPGESDQTLAYYHFVREECRTVRSNISPVPIRLCRLERAPGATTAALRR